MKILVRKDACIGWFPIYMQKWQTRVLTVNQSTGVQIYVNWEHLTLSKEIDILC